MNKQRPKELTLEVGELFSRQPLGYDHEIVSGTMPSYGRVILDIEIVDDTKCWVKLGALAPTSDDTNFKHKFKASSTAMVEIRGDFTDKVTEEFEELWL